MSKETGSKKSAPSKETGVMKRKRQQVAPRTTTTESEGPREAWSKSKKKRMRKLQQASNFEGKNHLVKSPSILKNDGAQQKSRTLVSEPHVQEDSRQPTKCSSLQQAFKARLSGSRFRVLNEELYTTTSTVAFDRFKANPELYDQYHEGFRYQVEGWPVNPIDVIVSDLRNLASVNDKITEKIVVADFGCGDAELAKQLLKVQFTKACPFQVHSFDLVSACDLVTACDMAHVPLQRSSVDVVIFCLSLMGSNLADFIREAHRVLKNKGCVKIAEVRSRFEARDGQDGMKEFTDVLDQLGFDCFKTDRSNKMFAMMELRKNGKKPKQDLQFTAKPCFYKRR
jgi:ribosomal RNA-processing protein 8